MSPSIAKSINSRILSALASTNQPQWSACVVPVNVAYLLKQKPEWVAKAITAFYHRDPVSQKSAQRFEHIGTAPKVNVMVRMTRCLYAQVSSQHWIPPRAYGVAATTPNTPLLVQKVAFDLGAKIALGFEILYQQELDRRNKMAASQAISTHSFANDPAWKTYLDKLKSIGYFRGLPETHFKAIELEKRAKQKYLALHPDKALSTLPPSLASEIDQLLGNFGKVGESSKMPDSQLVALFPDSDLFPSTSTEWMNISPDEVDRILFERQMEQEQLLKAQSRASNGPKSTSSAGDDIRSSDKATSSSGASDTQVDSDDEMNSSRQPDLFDRMVQDIEKFLVMKSGIDGVDLSPENPQSLPKRSQTTVRGDSAFPAPNGSSVSNEDSDSDEFYETDSDEDKVDLEDVDEMGETGEWPEVDTEAAQAKIDRMAMLELMREMDAQLLETELAKSFERTSSSAQGDGPDANNILDDTVIDDNINLVKNFIESYAAQNGVAGPVSTLLSQLEEWKKR